MHLQSLKRVSLRGGPNELVEGAEAEDESCLRSGSWIVPPPHPQVGVARQSPKLILNSGLHDGPTHITLKGTDYLSDVDRGTAPAVAPQVSTGGTASTSCSVPELRRERRLAPSPEARRIPSAAGSCVGKTSTRKLTALKLFRNCRCETHCMSRDRSSLLGSPRANAQNQTCSYESHRTSLLKGPRANALNETCS
jgi:hypothetical protein